jgi:catechol 2,3-dioxygenase-like lactoylglutathione lyase family enzyme
VEEATPILRVADAEVSVEWYQRLGYEKEWEHRFEPSLPAFVSIARQGASRLFLSEHSEDAGGPLVSGTVVHVRVADVDAIAALLDAAIVERPWAREVFLTDPDGNRLRIGTPNAEQSMSVRSERTVGQSVPDRSGRPEMSFDLYVFDIVDLPEDAARIGALLDDSSRRGAPYTPKLAAFVTDLERRYQGPEHEPDNSPWASWPLADSRAAGRRCAMHIVWSHAERMSNEIRQLCQQHGLTFYNPQTGIVLRPPRTKKRGLGQRRWS